MSCRAVFDELHGVKDIEGILSLHISSISTLVSLFMILCN